MKKTLGGIILNPYCGNYCVFCFNTKRLSPEKLRELEHNIYRNLIELRKKGIKHLEISGSDPIEYDKIIPLIKYIKKMGFEIVQLSTHGKRLSDKQFLSEFLLSGIDRLRIPLYGSNAKVHDSVTRTPGSFDMTIKGIKSILKVTNDIQIQISCLIVQQNKENLIELLDLVRKNNISNSYFSVPCVSNDDYSYYVPMKDLGQYVKKVYEYSKELKYPLKFLEIPYCVFGEFSNSIDNLTKPPDLGKFCQPPKEFRSKEKDTPSYRLKMKIDMCKDCSCSNKCDGFFVNDIDKFGTGKLKPIRNI